MYEQVEIKAKWTSPLKHQKSGIKHSQGLKVLGIILLSFLLGRGVLLQELSPFLLPFLVLLELKGSRYGVLVILSGVFGLYTIAPPTVFWPGFASLTMALIVMRALRSTGKITPYSVPPLVFAVVVVAKFLVLALLNVVLYSYLVVLVEAVIAAVLTVTYMVALPLLSGQKLSDKLAPEQLLSVAIFLAGVLSGLSDITVKGVGLLGIASKFFILVAAFTAGTGFSTVVGTMVGLIPSLAQGLSPMNVGVYAFAGMFSGMFARFGRMGIILGLLLASTCLSLYINGVQELIIVFEEAVIAILCFLVIPPQILDNLAAKASVKPKQVNQGANINVMTAGRIKEFSAIFTELAKAMEEAAIAGTEQVQLGLEMVVNQVKHSVCQGCSKHFICWETDVCNTVNLIRELLAVIESGGVVVGGRVHNSVRKHCLRQREVMVAVNCLTGTHKLGQYWQRRYNDSQELVTNQLVGVANIMQGLSQQIEHGQPMTGYEDDSKWPLRLEFGVSIVAKDQSFVSGDNYEIIPLEEGKVAVILSDGMGIGPKATVESKATIALLQQLLLSGFTTDVAIKTVNSLLSVRGKEDTFATVDLALIDLAQGQCEFVKIGAAPSFLKRGDQVGVIQSTSLPIGILKDIDADIIRQDLLPGDVLVMTTDGLLEANRLEQEDWIIKVLNHCKTDDPQNLSDYLLNMAGKGNNYSDDVLIIVAKVVENPDFIV